MNLLIFVPQPRSKTYLIFSFTAGSLNGGAVVSGEEGGKGRGGGVKSGGGMDGGQNLEQVFICISPSSSSFIDAAKESLPDKRHGKEN